MATSYTHEMKKKLAKNIQKIKKKEDLAKIVDLIMNDDPYYRENNNGTFFFFNKLKNETYAKIEKELNEIISKKRNSESSTSEGRKYTPYAADEFPSQKGISPKLKFSNREKSLIKRRRYDKNINQDVESDVVYTSFETDILSDSTKNS